MGRGLGAVDGLGSGSMVAGISVNGGLDGRQPGRDGGCLLGVGKSSGEMVDRGDGHAFGVGELGGVAENGGGGLVVTGLAGTIHGHAVVGTAGQSVA